MELKFQKSQNIQISSFQIENFDFNEQISLRYNLKGSKEIFDTKIKEFPKLNDKSLILSNKKILDSLSKFKFININIEKQKIFIKKVNGISKTLIFLL